MLYWIIQTTIISFILIYLVHHLFNFFKSTLTVPKIKDLVNAPTQKYENIYNILSHNSDLDLNTSKIDSLFYKNTELLPKPQTDMKNELKNFLKEQLNSDGQNSSTDISALDSMSSQMYSQYS
jgi:hypothetical protein